MLGAVRERTADPGLERRLIVGEEAVTRQPGPVQPVDRARLELDAVGDDYRPAAAEDWQPTAT